MTPRKAHLPTGAFLDFRVPLSTAWTRSSKGTVAPTSGPGAPVRRRWSLFSHCTYADTVGTVRLTRPQPYIAWTIFTPTCISFPHRPAVVLPSMDISIRPACIRCQDLCDCARANSDLRTGKRAHSCNPRPAEKKCPAKRRHGLDGQILGSLGYFRLPVLSRLCFTLPFFDCRGPGHGAPATTAP
jgi:hypothetical protein